jgi:hypothetical protein
MAGLPEGHDPWYVLCTWSHPSARRDSAESDAVPSTITKPEISEILVVVILYLG